MENFRAKQNKPVSSRVPAPAAIKKEGVAQG